MKKVTFCGALLLSGCTGVAPLDLNPSGTQSDGKMSLVVGRVLCELSEAKDKNPDLSKYVAVAQVTLKVEDTGGVTPSLSFIHPLAVAGTSTANAVGGEMTRGRLRSFTQNFVVRIKDAHQNCASNDGSNLQGDLGLSEIVKAGLNATTIHGAIPGSLKTDDAYFGSTVQFSSKVGLNGGPSITKTKFKGYGGNSGLLNISRSGTDVLTIAFAKISDRPLPGENSLFLSLTEADKVQGREDAAENAARTLLSRMILENVGLAQP